MDLGVESNDRKNQPNENTKYIKAQIKVALI